MWKGKIGILIPKLKNNTTMYTYSLNKKKLQLVKIKNEDDPAHKYILNKHNNIKIDPNKVYTTNW